MRNLFHVPVFLDQVKELRDRPDLAYELDNLETLCIQCHNAEHEKGKRACKIQDEERW
ncbi:HNH endonuclease [Bacillus cereus]